MKKNISCGIRLNKAVLVIFFSVIVKTNYSQNLFDYDNSVKFANYLYQSQDFMMAAREYERIAYINPGIDSIEYKLIKSLELSNNFQKAIERIEKTYLSQKNMPENITYEYAKTLILNNDFNKSRIFISGKNNLSMENVDVFSISVELLDNNYLKADSLLKKTLFINNTAIVKYRTLTNEALNTKFKKNWLGITMSALVPGTGKVYAGYWKDGLISTVMIGAAAFECYRGFKNSGIESGLGWVFGSIGFGFYIGNIYGTNKAINKKNKELIDRVHKKIKTTFSSIL